MKKILSVFSFITLYLATATFSTAQINIDPETKKILYQETISIDSLNKQELYDRALEWMAIYFQTNKFDVNDKVNLKLAQEGNFPVTYAYDFKYKKETTVLYTLSMSFKDGKYRYTLTDFKIYENNIGPKSTQALEVYYQKMKTDAKKEFTNKFPVEVNKVIEEMKTNMAAAKKNEAEDW